jgi:hypothetical protein
MKMQMFFALIKSPGTISVEPLSLVIPLLKIRLPIPLPKFISSATCLILSHQSEQKHFTTLFQHLRGICVLSDETHSLGIFHVLSTVFELLMQIHKCLFLLQMFQTALLIFTCTIS